MNKSVEIPRYTVWQTSSRGQIDRYEIRKFLDREEPEDVYCVEFNNTRGTIWCDCFGFARMSSDKNQHKHIKLVREWIKRGRKSGEIYRIEGDVPIYIKNLLD